MPHGLIGVKNGANLVMQNDIKCLLEDIQQFSEPVATTYVCDRILDNTTTLVSPKNDGIEAVYLPPYWS
jgi:hypothetical protein